MNTKAKREQFLNQEKTSDREKILKWLHSIFATPEEIECAIEQCTQSKDDRAYYLERARHNLNNNL